MLVCHPTHYSFAIAFQGLYFLEYYIKDSNLAANWQEPTIQTSLESYQVMYLVHNLFATLSTTSFNIPQSSLLPTIINVPDTNPSFLISTTTQDSTLTIYLNVMIHKC